MKLIVKIRKPRKPFALDCSRRKGGSHRRCKSTLRQEARVTLRRELDRLVASP